MDNRAKPDILTEFIDATTNCTVRCYSYRKLTIGEVRQGVKLWLSSEKRKTLPKNGLIKIYSIHGFDD